MCNSNFLFIFFVWFEKRLFERQLEDEKKNREEMKNREKASNLQQARNILRHDTSTKIIGGK